MVRAEGLTEKFRDDGFVVVREFLDADRIAEVCSNVDRYVEDVVPGLPGSEAFYEHAGRAESLKQMHRLDQNDPWFAELLNDGPQRALAERLLGGAVVPKNIEWFDKPPGMGLATPPHQDGFYFKLEPCEALTAWIALDAADEENGCVRYIPGSQLAGMRPHGSTGTLGFSQGITDYSDDSDRPREVPVVVRAGDLLVHHAMTIHRADQNRSRKRSRRAIGFVYYAAHAREDSAAHEKYQRDLTEQLTHSGRIRDGS